MPPVKTTQLMAPDSELETESDPQPSTDPNCLLEPLDNEPKVNAIKHWLSGNTPFLPALEPTAADTFAMRKALVHGIQHITQVLYPSSIHLVNAMDDDVEVRRDYMIKAGNRFEWEKMDDSCFLNETDQEKVLLMLGAARKEIVWVKEEMERFKGVAAEAVRKRILGYDAVAGWGQRDGWSRVRYVPRKRPDM
ncbi:hypothetical protein K431DRAFT_280406, partial [Polychaeton citri CBS 116435]